MRNDCECPKKQSFVKARDLHCEPSQLNIFINDKHQSYVALAWQTFTAESKYVGKHCALLSYI